MFTLTAGLYPSLLFEAQKKYLQAQGITRPPMYVVLICMVLFPGIAYLYVFTFNLGFLVRASACVMYSSLCNLLTPCARPDAPGCTNGISDPVLATG